MPKGTLLASFLNWDAKSATFEVLVLNWDAKSVTFHYFGVPFKNRKPKVIFRCPKFKIGTPKGIIFL